MVTDALGSVPGDSGPTEYQYPVGATLAVIGDWWKVVILFHLIHDGTHRCGGGQRHV